MGERRQLKEKRRRQFEGFSEGFKGDKIVAL